MYMLRAVREVQEQFGRRRDCVFTYFQRTLRIAVPSAVPPVPASQCKSGRFSKIAL